ncbi:MAG TPA: lytic transglycosylase domain-containing protein [Anaeromyxobacteraceae bacterium]|nr:lytic transglycosylase domain-containing protein [Anaeromyxobacteraceae bacterium]
MARLSPILALMGMLAAPALAAADDVYSFIDADGVIHVTNVPQDPRYRRMKGARPPAVKMARRGPAGRAPPLMLRRTSAYDEHIQAAAERFGLAPPLLKAVMAVESNFDPSAISVKGATGLMQLMPATAREMYVVDLYDPAQNIEGGARYLRALQDRFGGNLEQVLAAYNAGPEAVRRSGGAVPNIPETRAYVRKVIALYETYMRGG